MKSLHNFKVLKGRRQHQQSFLWFCINYLYITFWVSVYKFYSNIHKTETTINNPKFRIIVNRKLLFVIFRFYHSFEFIEQLKLNIFKSGNETRFAALYRLSKITIHPEYTPQGDKNDIALIQTARPMNFNEAVGAVCLPFRLVKSKSCQIKQLYE